MKYAKSSLSEEKTDEISSRSMNPGQDRQPLAPLQDPPDDDMRMMIEQAIEDITSAAQGHDTSTVLGTNLLEALFQWSYYICYRLISMVTC